MSIEWCRLRLGVDGNPLRQIRSPNQTLNLYYPHTCALDSSIRYVGEVTAVFMISHTYLVDVIVSVTLKGWFTQKWKFCHLLTLCVWACLRHCTTILNVYSHLWVYVHCVLWCVCVCVWGVWCVLYGSLIAVVFNGYRKPLLHIRPSFINPLSLPPSLQLYLLYSTLVCSLVLIMDSKLSLWSWQCNSFSPKQDTDFRLWPGISLQC